MIDFMFEVFLFKFEKNYDPTNLIFPKSNLCIKKCSLINQVHNLQNKYEVNA
jgi:hypothetical protein